MTISFSSLITIIFSNRNEEGYESEKLAGEIAAECLSLDYRCRCLPLNSLVTFKPQNSENGSLSSSSIDGTSCELLNILKDKNGHGQETFHTVVFIFDNLDHNPAIKELENTLNDWSTDFRVDKSLLSGLHFDFVILGDYHQSNHGDSNYIFTLRRLLISLGSNPLHPNDFYLNPGDIGKIISLVDQIREAQNTFIESFSTKNNYKKREDSDYEDNTVDSDDDSEVDIENLGQAEQKMVSDKQRKQLIKQGYKLIGDHSAVKLCRWTKARVRGHGGCYKHTFYGINSNQCMEMTPSLACANKCVFCWRHHTNPVSTRWKWEADDPKFILNESINAHLRLIKELKGIFDTKMERFNEAMRIRHCALSLVGEPIMYPKINELLSELHQHEISTFLVTNAQFPKEIENLIPVTQLYVSIDASDKQSLENIDRPLFRDFWERFVKCIELLKNRKERTVFRLTMVRNFNMSEQRTEIEGYANLMKLGEPDFVEIKAVTFCGTVHDNAITMKNVPWHDEIVEFAKALIDISDYTREHYEIACEHRHSCCILIAKKSYFVNGKWKTWIDYPLFHKLATSGEEFSGIDYSCETPSWALFGSPEQGFDPVDTRIYTKGRHKLN
ncbi:hypothetical protein BEWA_033500 [Theileria equi strain WA]|uniref:Radical SAM core domain-containing protein n=1 Tax=Theileria equi strain WA TaxID=1537102 RepID=L0AY39_THEEQ|nr:hypothetical protein BEWA_033500 [Theileria equi strain WA]AFZ80497.1 hypothetical protein BEWA_033500 [Theileria equi strain WA]|eukprot:XP_004830163.1 hypothetical protein BEWA_033500 [Theileria equi strain WA]